MSGSAPLELSGEWPLGSLKCTRDYITRRAQCTFNGEHPPRTDCVRVMSDDSRGKAHGQRGERRRADAEAVRHQRELERQPAERARDAAEASRVAAENGRRALADNVNDTVETLTIILKRMEAVEALRRDARVSVPAAFQLN
jgi:hypothetical protein